MIMKIWWEYMSDYDWMEISRKYRKIENIENEENAEC